MLFFLWHVTFLGHLSVISHANLVFQGNMITNNMDVFIDFSVVLFSHANSSVSCLLNSLEGDSVELKNDIQKRSFLSGVILIVYQWEQWQNILMRNARYDVGRLSYR